MSLLFPNSPEPYRPPPLDAATLKALIDAAPDRYPAPGSARLGDVAGNLSGRHSLPKAAKPKPPIRSTRKAADWTRGIYRAHSYLAPRIRDPGQRAELDALLERTIEAGPDFLRVRVNADFKPVPIVAYSREAAVEIMRQAREIERETYATRAKGEHGGAIGRMGLQLLEWFAFILWPKSGRFGMVPSLAHIAGGARMSRATVVEAMKRLELFGFLTVNRRRKRVETLLGFRVVQDTSAYVLGVAKGLGTLALAALAKRPKESEADRGARISESTRSSAIKSEHYSSLWLWKTRDQKPVSVPMRT